MSGYGCYQGRDWGYDNNGVWVSNGCSARFEVGGGGGHNNDAGNAIAVVAGLAILANGYPPVYGNFSNGAIYFGGQGMAVQPSGGVLSIGGSFFRGQ